MKYTEICKLIKDNKNNLILIINNMILFYIYKENHDKITICNSLITLLNLNEQFQEFDINNLKDILLDSANINLVKGNFEIGTLSMNLLFKISELY